MHGLGMIKETKIWKKYEKMKEKLTKVAFIYNK